MDHVKGQVVNQFKGVKTVKNEWKYIMSEEAKVGLDDETIAIVSIGRKDGVKKI